MPLSNPLREWLSQTPSPVMGVASEVRLTATVRDHATMETALFDELASRQNPDLVMTSAYDGSFDAQMKLRGPYSGPRDQLWVHRAVERSRWDAVAAWFDLGGVLTTEDHQPLTALVWRRLCQTARMTDPTSTEPALELLDVLRERMLEASPGIYRKEMLGTLRAWAMAKDEPQKDATMRHRLFLCQNWVNALLDARPLVSTALNQDDTRGLPDRSVDAIRALLTRAEQRHLRAMAVEDRTLVGSSSGPWTPPSRHRL